MAKGNRFRSQDGFCCVCLFAVFLGVSPHREDRGGDNSTKKSQDNQCFNHGSTLQLCSFFQFPERCMYWNDHLILKKGKYNQNPA